MKVLHVRVEQEEGWFIAQGIEEAGVIAQGRSLNEIVANVRQVVELMFNRKNIDIELLLPSRLSIPRRAKAGRGKKMAAAH